MYHIGLIDQNMQKHVCRGNISSSCKAKLPKTLRTGTQWVVQPQSTRTSSSTNFLLTGLHWAASTGKPLDLQYSCTGSDEKIQDIPGDLSLQSRIPPKMYVNSLAWVAIVPLLQDRAPTFALVLWKPAIVITTVFYGTGQMVARSWCSNSKLAMETFCSRSDTSILCLVFPNRFFTFRHIQHVQNIIHIHSHIHLYSDDKPYEYIWLYIYSHMVYHHFPSGSPWIHGNHWGHGVAISWLSTSLASVRRVPSGKMVNVYGMASA